MRVLALLCALAGCTQGPAARMDDIPLRNPTAPIASQSNVDLSGISGDWIVLAGAGLQAGTQVRIAQDHLILNGAQIAANYNENGRFDIELGALWVLWADVDRRTLVLGDPQGTQLWVLDREADASPDRMQAAREILEWYGYDMTRLANL